MNRRSDDRGTVLPLVLVFVVVIGFVVAGLSRYAATNLRYSTVVRDRAAASASAEAGLRYAIERVRANSVTTCNNGPARIAPTNGESINNAAIDITCQRLDGEPATLAGWAAVVTGVGIGGATDLLIEDEGDHGATGRIFVTTLRQADFRINIEDVEFDGNMFYDGSGDDCATIDEYQESSSSWDDDIELTSGSFVCWPQSWDEIVDEPAIATLPAPAATPPAWTTSGSCRVFEPGYYTSLELQAGGANYFRSGAYVFHDVLIDTSYDAVTNTNHFDTTILAGRGADVRFDTRLITSGDCAAAQAADGVSGGQGVTWYLSGSTKIEIRRDTTIEMIPMLQSDGTAVSIHVLDSSDADYDSTLAANVAVIDESGSSNEALFQGQIWAPTQPVDLEDTTGDADGQVTSGVVAAQIRIDSDPGDTGTLGPDLTPVDHELLLSSTATVGNVTIEARAVVEYRPIADVADRVAVRSIRFVN